MNIVRYTKEGARSYVEITYLGEGETRGWLPRDDGGGYRYQSWNKGAVVVDARGGLWHWHEYDYPNAEVDSIADALVEDGYIAEIIGSWHTEQGK